jgi:alkanesulfonate monooxygenase SsuD/methylene tetrahydromethanopterin reductase-like flavin-dependent oxidoreductase (luciferase family)
MKYSVTGSMGAGWSHLRDIVLASESLGFDAFYTSDHLEAFPGWSDTDAGVLDAVTVLSALSECTNTIRLGVLVSPITWREPVGLSRTLMTVDHVSSGRAEIGIGCGAMAQEHENFGIPFPSLMERTAMLKSACKTIQSLWESEGPVNLRGDLREAGRAIMRPRPVQKRAPILVGGGSEAVMRIAAQYAVKWNVTGTPTTVGDKVIRLREFEAELERDGTPVEISVMVVIHMVGRPEEASVIRSDVLPTPPRAVMCDANAMNELVKAYAAVGVERLVFSIPPASQSVAELERLAKASLSTLG